MEKPEDLLQKIAALEDQNQQIQSRLEEAEEALRAIGSGEVDALVVYGDQGERIYTLQGAEHAYRVMVESIHEGAANIKEDGTILYCNKRLAEMLEMPLEVVLGSSFHNYLMPAQKETFLELTHNGLESFGKAEFNLACYQRPAIPVLITASAAEVDGRRGISLVVTDLSEQKQALARERELQARLMEQREEERVRIARNLHDGPLQDLIGLSFALEAFLPKTREPAGENDLVPVREGVLKIAGDLRSVCNELRPPSTIRFGLSRAIQYQSEDLQAKYPNLKIRLELAEDGQSLPNDVRNGFFRIYQECMNNVIRHANATVVNIRFVINQNSLLLEVHDNGKGFQPPQDWVELARQGHLGLVGMRERAEALGGKLQVLSGNCNGTTIQVETPSGFTNA
ncbi:MAG: PAS domain-containing protein [Chloroflexi bacterium]|nr:MAG: PAS domain-containing protein [Chloroflexota bacterium]